MVYGRLQVDGNRRAGREMDLFPRISTNSQPVGCARRVIGLRIVSENLANASFDRANGLGGDPYQPQGPFIPKAVYRSGHRRGDCAVLAGVNAGRCRLLPAYEPSPPSG